KPAVYDHKGWHPMPYLDQGEFYSEFGSFDVSISVPQGYVVAATGRQLTDNRQPVTDDRTGNPVVGGPLSVIRFRQDSIHDFAWFADKRFTVVKDTVQLPSGKMVDVLNYYLPGTKGKTSLFSEGAKYAKDAVRFYSREVGEYPYGMVSVVEGPESFGGGMEYPTITVISPTPSAKELDITIAHEVGHNWFYGMLASNERRHPWMDEGMNTLYTNKYADEKYGTQDKAETLFFLTKAKHRTDQPIETASENFSAVNYGVVAYTKAGDWMQMMEDRLGKERFRQMMQEYFAQWKFRHPYPEDFRSIARNYLGNDSMFALLEQRGPLPNQLHDGFSLVSPFKKNSIKNYLRQPTRNALLLSPMIGANKYDRFMIGGLITNYKLPPSDFQFLLSPLYATGTKELVGLGKLNYSFYPGGFLRRAEIFLNASRFSMDEFTDTAGNRISMQFSKLVPGLRFTFRERNERSTARTYLQWKTFLINEEWLSIRPDTLFNGPDTALILRYLTPREDRYVNRLQFVYEDSRALYPFSVELRVDQAKDFVRPTLNFNYFFNYPKDGGLQLRLFAGKFIYLEEKTLTRQFQTERYHLNMTGPNGYEDYTYSNYFYGRNEFEGAASQQVMIQDGGFKVRTDLLASKIGKTDDWLAAINLNTSIPDKINPLSVLPIKIPLRVFADIGTYAEAWKRNADADRFLFDAGLHLPLVRGMVNVYIPLVYNRVYGDYFKSTIPKNRFLKTISFSVNLYNHELKEINRELEF
ncbi:MAG TPA: M1 family metallopeptidase, partial [Flavisolibacter sp.]